MAFAGCEDKRSRNPHKSATVRVFKQERVSKTRFVSGHDFGRAENRRKTAGFDPRRIAPKTCWAILKHAIDGLIRRAPCASKTICILIPPWWKHPHNTSLRTSPKCHRWPPAQLSCSSASTPSLHRSSLRWTKAVRAWWSRHSTAWSPSVCRDRSGLCAAVNLAPAMLAMRASMTAKRSGT